MGESPKVRDILRSNQRTGKQFAALEYGNSNTTNSIAGRAMNTPGRACFWLKNALVKPFFANQ
jgi:hypothetical protein